MNTSWIFLSTHCKNARRTFPSRLAIAAVRPRGCTAPSRNCGRPSRQPTQSFVADAFWAPPARQTWPQHNLRPDPFLAGTGTLAPEAMGRASPPQLKCRTPPRSQANACFCPSSAPLRSPRRTLCRRLGPFHLGSLYGHCDRRGSPSQCPLL